MSFPIPGESAYDIAFGGRSFAFVAPAAGAIERGGGWIGPNLYNAMVYNRHGTPIRGSDNKPVFLAHTRANIDYLAELGIHEDK